MDIRPVITTKFVLENKSPIISVFRDEEGDWQFFGKENEISEEDARIVSLNEILEFDPSIKDILWITNNMQAWRDKAGGEWRTGVY